MAHPITSAERPPRRGRAPVTFGWHDAAFLHWPVAAAPLERCLPAGVTLDLWHGEAWLSVVAFWMDRTRVLGMPVASPRFAELNLRTYARQGDCAGVWFLSLDATSPAMVAAGRAIGFAYRRAAISLEATAVRSVPRGHASVGSFEGAWTLGGPKPPTPHEAWLAERYAAFAGRPGGAARVAPVRHDPWALRAIRDVVVTDAALVAPWGAAGSPPVAFASPGVEARAWMPRR